MKHAMFPTTSAAVAGFDQPSDANTFENMYPFQYAMGHLTSIPRSRADYAGEDADVQVIDDDEDAGVRRENDAAEPLPDPAPPKPQDVHDPLRVAQLEQAKLEVEKLRLQLKISQEREKHATTQSPSSQQYMSRPIAPSAVTKPLQRHPSPSCLSWSTFVRVNVEFAKLFTLVLIILAALALHSALESAIDPLVSLKGLTMKPWGLLGLRLVYPLVALMAVWIMKYYVTCVSSGGLRAART